MTVLRGNAVGLVAFVWLATSAWGVTRTVPAQYANIQAAVDACSNGDVVVVSAGRYDDFDFRGKAITVRSTNPTKASVVASTIVDGTLHLTMNVVRFQTNEGRNSIVDGFTIFRGERGVYCRRSSPTIRNRVIDASDSISILVEESGAPLIYKNLIKGGHMNAAICCGGTTTPIVRSNRMINNDHGAIEAGQQSRPIIEDNIIKSPFSGMCEAAIICYGGTIRRNEIRDYEAEFGAIKCYGKTSICYNLIANNSAYDSGGGIWCSGSANIVSNTICDNKSAPSRGGNICVASGSPIIKNNIIAFAGAGSGIVNLGTGTPKVTYCSFFSNVGANYTGRMTVGPGLVLANPRLNRTRVGVGDYRLKSKYGRWTATGWVLDTVQSPCVDKGDPASVYAAEPAPNGGRLNLGYDGNTVRASKSASGGAVALAQSITAAAAGTTNGGAQFAVGLNSAANVQVMIANIAGRTVVVLPASDLPAGVTTLLWNGQSSSGSKVPAGSYVARLTARGENGGQAEALAMLTVRR